MSHAIRGGELKGIQEPHCLNDVLVEEYEGNKCLKCVEIFFSWEAYDAIDRKVKPLGIWELGGVPKVGQSGNTLMVRISRRIARIVGLEQDGDVFVHPEGKSKLVLKLSKGGE